MRRTLLRKRERERERGSEQQQSVSQFFLPLPGHAFSPFLSVGDQRNFTSSSSADFVIIDSPHFPHAGSSSICAYRRSAYSFASEGRVNNSFFPHRGWWQQIEEACSFLTCQRRKKEKKDKGKKNGCRRRRSFLSFLLRYLGKHKSEAQERR